MANPNLRCQVANAVFATVPLIHNHTCISDVAIDLADVMFSTVAKLAPCSMCLRGAKGLCVGPGVEAEMNEVWQQREKARRCLRVEPHNSNLKKNVKICKTAALRLFGAFVRRPKTHVQKAAYKHLKTMDLEGKRDRSSVYVKYDKVGILLKDVELICERWVRWFHTLFNAKSPRIDPKPLISDSRTCR